MRIRAELVESQIGFGPKIHTADQLRARVGVKSAIGGVDSRNQENDDAEIQRTANLLGIGLFSVAAAVTAGTITFAAASAASSGQTDAKGVSRGTAWYLNNQNDSSGPEYSFTYGSSGDIPVVGNWDGTTSNRDDTIGVYRGGSWYLNNQNDNSAADISFAFGGALDTPVPANFDGSASNKSDTAGLVRGR